MRRSGSLGSRWSWVLVAWIGMAWSARVQAQPAPDAPAASQGEGEADAEAELAALRARVERLEAALEASSAGAERVEELEQQVEDLREDLDDLQVQNEEAASALSARMDRATRVFGYTTSFLRLREEGDVDFRGFRVNVMLDTRLSANLRFFAEIELEDGAFIGSAEAESGLIEVERGFFEFTFDPAIGVRAGILLAAFGHFNLDHQGWRFPFSERPIAYDRIFPATYADVGVELFGTLLSNDELSVSYRVSALNGLRAGFGRLRGGAVDFSNGLRGARPLFHSDNNDAKSVAGRVSLTIGEHVDIGANGYWGIYADDDDANAAVSMAGLDVWLSWTDVTVRAEGILGFVGEDVVQLDGTDPTGAPITVSSRTPSWMSGAYVELEGRFMPEAWHDSALGHFGQPREARFFAAGRADYARIDLRDPILLDGFPQQRALEELRLSASVGYRPVVQSAVRLEILYGFGNGLMLSNEWMAKLSFALGY